MHKHPQHYTGRTRELQNVVTIDGRYNPYELDKDYAYIVCNCGFDIFEVYVSEYPEVKCKCTACGEEYLIYDVDHYPAATGYAPAKGKLEKWSSKAGMTTFKVVAGWSYPEDPEDDNDIDWFVLVVHNPETDEYIEVVNDETA